MVEIRNTHFNYFKFGTEYLCLFLGGSFGGKTKACKILAASLQAVKGSTGKAPTCVLLNPKSVKIDQVTYTSIIFKKIIVL